MIEFAAVVLALMMFTAYWVGYFKGRAEEQNKQAAWIAERMERST